VSYTVSVWVKADAGTTAQANLWVHDTVNSNTSVFSSTITPGTTWQQLSVTYVADSTGKLRIALHYLPGLGTIYFDDVRVAAPNPPGFDNHYKFTGKERDSETGLDYFGARYYSNRLGRFITPDWAGKPAPVPYAHLDDPQSLNLYSYVGNDPLSHADSDGHAGKEYQLSGKYTVRLDKTNPNDMPNVHVSKGGNEIARGRVNPNTGAIDWVVYPGKQLGGAIRGQVQTLAQEKGLFEAARQRFAEFQRLRAGAAGEGEGEGGGGGRGGRTLNGILNFLMLVDVAVNEIGRARFNSHEPATGVHVDIAGTLVVTGSGEGCKLGASGILD
jgi:RHS repeat-associated protein